VKYLAEKHKDLIAEAQVLSGRDLYPTVLHRRSWIYRMARRYPYGSVAAAFGVGVLIGAFAVNQKSG